MQSDTRHPSQIPDWLEAEMAGLDTADDRALQHALRCGVESAPGLRALVESAYRPPRGAPLGQLPTSRPRIWRPGKGGGDR
jgi:hypothetical protein